SGGTGGATATGGTTSTGGTAGTGGTTSAGGTTGSGTTPANCTAVPVVPNATQQTRNVLCYLHSIYGNGILSGQEEDNNDNGMNTVFAATGKYPAIRAFDVNNSEAPTQCVTHWNNGGICMFGYHMGINGGTYSTPTNITNVLTAGTAENTSFNADLDRIAQFVTPLKTAGGVAILRLFHEAGNGCSWFWWSMGTSAQWQSLFKYAFDYLTATKGLNNVLFLAPLCQHPTTAYNPGAQYIDFGGADDYVAAGDTEPLTSLFQQTETAFPNMMVALHECGTIPDPDQLQSTGTKWLFFNVWASPYFNAPYNTTAHLQEVYSNTYVITRDKLPSFK
ncbi:MAG: glycosyl hydrolase, partial [Polyangia bacterium]